MKCNHCRMSVEKSLKEVRGVKDAAVDLETKTATVYSDVEIPDILLMDAIRAKGFMPVKIL